MYVSQASYSALKYLCRIPLENVYRISLSKEIKAELYRILSLVISQNYFRKPKSLETLSYLLNFQNNQD
jgi:DNA repair protein RecO (recombination protein O)